MSELTAAAPLLDAVRRLPPGHALLPGTTAGELLESTEAAARGMRDEGLRAGEAVALRAPNGPSWVLACLALLAAGARPLLLDPGAPEAEVARMLSSAGGARRCAVPGEGAPPALSGPPGAGADGGPGVLLPTSGSTGSPRIVLRGEASLLSEGLRYRAAVGLTERDTLLLPVPLSHAYALGWLFGGLLGGARLRPVPPTALGRIAAELADGATVVALVPPLARLLAARESRRAARRSAPARGRDAAPRLRLAMVGAGPVDEPLETAFREAFGTGLARNYGSTETGAVLCGPAGLAPLCAGGPMPGVATRLTDPADGTVTADGPGLLAVRVDGRWHDTGDLAVAVPGGLRLLGREDRAIRRGGRWVSPLEVESALGGHPDVGAVRVRARPGSRPGEDGILAEVTLRRPGSTPDGLREHAARQLAPYKVPDEIRIRDALPTSAAGKVRAEAVYRLAPAALDAARAYKVSELLFALHDLGALEALSAGTDATRLAAELGCDADALETLLRTAAGLGVLTEGTAGPPGQRVPADGLGAFVRLEEHLSRHVVTREELAATARAGLAGRSFERTSPGELRRLTGVYQAAMDGPGARARAALGLRLLAPPPGAHLVEVSAGPGRYLGRLLGQDPSATGQLIPVGPLAGEPDAAVRAAAAQGRASVGGTLPRGTADLCVVANAVHGPGPGSDLAALLAALRPGGALLVDDVFLPAAGGTGGELGLDWLTHGASAWPTAEELLSGLLREGADIGRHLAPDRSLCHLILAKEASP
ncbi:AMP-binding protein [Streptomyces gamaensis]|uniref:AMP-binding protein n=1 Tax=Streptomyces gamaensis TaxID=1763542 RepID=A0ABW0YSG6_9ACTN